ncbi:1-phosphofructokinase [Phycicoccus sp. BSK3Z-2]|uniref:1-phosphofructokinase n=1 Tax=Phycicoccus avicenniae TaxID=2828860 RepID=A0A941D6C6_9MICO|nr:PfkB family carbohydrate kinase [Phycicoccus avicenniae]MBR7742468.1 1-phosphofructokinase [Phycicoccus avicenniae]
MTTPSRVVVVTPNPAVDVTYRVDEQRLGETVRVRDVVRRPGGKGVNVTRVLTALGVPAVAVQPVGGAAGAWFAESLGADVDAVCVPSPVGTRTTVAVDDRATHPTLFAEPGDPQPAEVWDRVVGEVDRLAVPGGWVVVSGSLPPETPVDLVARLVAASHGAGARVLVDTSGAPLLAAAEARADLLTPNADEARSATGADDVRLAVDDLLACGAGAVVVSRGADGLLARTATGAEAEQAAVPGVSGNPTGAGDAATAGLLEALGADAVSAASLAPALRRAAVVAAAAVLSAVAGDADPAVLDGLDARLAPPPPTRPREESP